MDSLLSVITVIPFVIAVYLQTPLKSRLHQHVFPWLVRELPKRLRYMTKRGQGKIGGQPARSGALMRVKTRKPIQWVTFSLRSRTSEAGNSGPPGAARQESVSSEEDGCRHV